MSETAEQIKKTVAEYKERTKNETLEAYYNAIMKRIEEIREKGNSDIITINLYAVENIIGAAYDEVKGVSNE